MQKVISIRADMENKIAPAEAARIAQNLRSALADLDRIARQKDDIFSEPVAEMSRFIRNDLLVAAQMDAGKTHDEAAGALVPDHMDYETFRYLWKWIGPALARRRRQDRNRLVWRLRSLGWSNKRIAAHLNLSERTVAAIFGRYKKSRA